jgi:Tol biopolymer transport system component
MRRLLVLGIAPALVSVASSAAGSMADSFRAGNPSWSPDGRTVVFDGSTDGALPDIYTIAVDGTGLRNLTPDDPERNVLPSWGRRIGDIAYETDLSNPQQVKVRYSVIAPDGSDGRVLAPNESAIGPVYWSAGDHYLAFDGRFNARVLALASADAESARSVTVGLSGPWAPRVMRLALGVERVNAVHLETASPSGAKRRRLTRGHESVRPLAWSHDGSRILFEGARGSSSGFSLYVIKVTSKGIRRLAAGARMGDFSPNGKWVAYSREGGGIYVVSVDGSGRRRISADGVNPRWSPDGSWIAFQAGDRIDLVHADGSGRRTLAGS